MEFTPDVQSVQNPVINTERGRISSAVFKGLAIGGATLATLGVIGEKSYAHADTTTAVTCSDAANDPCDINWPNENYPTDTDVVETQKDDGTTIRDAYYPLPYDPGQVNKVINTAGTRTTSVHRDGKVTCTMQPTGGTMTSCEQYDAAQNTGGTGGTGTGTGETGTGGTTTGGTETGGETTNDPLADKKRRARACRNYALGLYSRPNRRDSAYAWRITSNTRGRIATEFDTMRELTSNCNDFQIKRWGTFILSARPNRAGTKFRAMSTPRTVLTPGTDTGKEYARTFLHRRLPCGWLMRGAVNSKVSVTIPGTTITYTGARTPALKDSRVSRVRC